MTELVDENNNPTNFLQPAYDVKRFVVVDKNGQDQVTIILGPEKAMIQTAKWPRDDAGVTDFGRAQTITMDRHSLIGLAYEILNSLGK